MSLELAIFISLAAMMLTIVNLWALSRIRGKQERIMTRVWHRLNYMEMGMSYHELIPLPWEVQDLEEPPPKTKRFKQEGNIVYLNDD